MPFAVSRWPNRFDPRSGQFAIVGWSATGVPPWKLRVITTGALSPYEMFNPPGVIIEPSIVLAGETHWQYQGSATNFNVELIVYGFSESQPAPVAHTINWFLSIAGTPAPICEGSAFATLPDPILHWPALNLFDATGPVVHFPNPVELIPTKWNIPIAP